MRRTLFLMFLLVAAGLPLQAEICTVELFPHSINSVATATVTTAKEPLLRDYEGCPSAGPQCMTKAYVVQGNVVLAAQTQNVWRCVSYFNGTRQTVGWMKGTSLQETPAKPGSGSLAGHWVREQGDSTIDIVKRGAGLYATAMTTVFIREGNVRTGGAEGVLQVKGDHASFGAAGSDRTRVCNVHLRLLGDLLLADDGATDDSNSACGGMGVTEGGVYRRMGR